MSFIFGEIIVLKFYRSLCPWDSFEFFRKVGRFSKIDFALPPSTYSFDGSFLLEYIYSTTISILTICFWVLALYALRAQMSFVFEALENAFFIWMIVTFHLYTYVAYGFILYDDSSPYKHLPNNFSYFIYAIT